MRENELQKQLGTLFYDSCPYAVVVFDSGYNVVHGNESAVKLFGFADRDKLVADLGGMFAKNLPAFQANASPTTPINKRLEYAEKNYSITYETERIINEIRLYLRVILKRMDFEDGFVIVGYFIDVSDLRQARTDLFKQEYLLRQINRVATLLSDASSEVMDSSVNNVMKITAEGIEADRICIYKNDNEDKAVSCKIISSWASGYLEQFPQEIDYSSIEDFYLKLSKNRSINKAVGELSETERALFATAGTKSVLIIPLFLFGKFWGILFLENRRNDRIHNRMEISVAQSAGIIIISSWIRNETNKQLILAKEAAQASDRAKMDFLSRMSHEIRTPLNAIIGMTAISKRDIQDKSAQEKLNKIEFASLQLLHIINDILDMSKIESGRLEINLTEFDFFELIENITTMMRVEVDSKNQNFICELPRFDRKIFCDDLHLRQIIVNLLSNAIKFTPDGGTVKLFVSYEETDSFNYKLTVSVADTGIGISKDHQKKLFTSFEQADGGIARRFGGTGLGLAISKRLSVLMGGDISVESEEGEGSTFSFYVPFTFGEKIDDKKQQESGDIPADISYDWKGKRILLVEDTDINREIIIEILKDTGVNVEIAENGKIALEIFTQSPMRYDLILMDVQMPEMDGLEATRRIRALSVDSAKTVPIVAMTANAFSGDVANCINAGMNAHIAKPVDVDMLFKKIAEYI